MSRKEVQGQKIERIIFWLPIKLKKQIRLICMERGIEMSSYIRESIIKNNKNYKYLISKIK